MNIALCPITPLRNKKEATAITVLELARELTRKGHNTVIIAGQGKGLPNFHDIDGIPVYRPSYIPFLGKIISLPFTVRKVQQERKIKLDVIHTFSATPLFALSCLGSKAFARKAATIHTLKSYSRSKYGSNFFLLLNLVKAVTVPTEVFAKKLKFVPKKKIQVIHSPISRKKFQPKNKEELKKKYGYENKRVLLYYGSMHEHKGVDVLIEALPLIAKEVNNIEVIIAPRYSEIEPEKNHVKFVGAENFTKFITDDIPIEEYVAMADVVVLPYKSMIATEGNPSCLLESMACKTPLVTSDLPELGEIAEGCILFSKPEDVNLLAEKILLALDNYPSEMVEKAYIKSGEFDSEVIIEEILDLYKKVVSET